MTGPISLSRCGVSPRPMTCETTLAPRRCMKPRPLLPIAGDANLLGAAGLPAPSSGAATMRRMLVFRPPHSPLSVVTTMMPTRLTGSRSHQERDAGTRGWRAPGWRHDVRDLLAVGPGGAHALLRLAHLGRRHHFHGLGDLLRALDALDLGADFFAARHGDSARLDQAQLCLNSSIAAASAFSASASRSLRGFDLVHQVAMLGSSGTHAAPLRTPARLTSTSSR